MALESTLAGAQMTLWGSPKAMAIYNRLSDGSVKCQGLIIVSDPTIVSDGSIKFSDLGIHYQALI